MDLYEGDRFSLWVRGADRNAWDAGLNASHPCPWSVTIKGLPDTKAKPMKRGQSKSFSGDSTLHTDYQSDVFRLNRGRYEVTLNATAGFALPAGSEYFEQSACDYVIDLINVTSGIDERLFEVAESTQTSFQSQLIISKLDVYDGDRFAIWVRDASRGASSGTNATHPCPWKITIRRLK